MVPSRFLLFSALLVASLLPMDALLRNQKKFVFFAGLEGAGHERVIGMAKECTDRGTCWVDPWVSKDAQNRPFFFGGVDGVMRLSPLLRFIAMRHDTCQAFILNAGPESSFMSFPDGEVYKMVSGDMRFMGEGHLYEQDVAGPGYPSITTMNQAVQEVGGELKVVVLRRHPDELIAQWCRVIDPLLSCTKAAERATRGMLEMVRQLQALKPEQVKCTNYESMHKDFNKNLTDWMGMDFGEEEKVVQYKLSARYTYDDEIQKVAESLKRVDKAMDWVCNERDN